MGSIFCHDGCWRARTVPALMSQQINAELRIDGDQGTRFTVLFPCLLLNALPRWQK
jgi:hypothetical protein